MKIGINAGHTKLSKGTGASGILNESKETRKIAYEVMKQLADTQHEVIPLVYDKSNDNLKAAVTDANNKKLDLFVSIHLNAGGGQGCEVYTYKCAKLGQATKVLGEMKKLGFRNRGIKDGTNFYVVRNTLMPALLIEVCFVDNPNDAQLYKKVGVEKIAQAIVNAIK